MRNYLAPAKLKGTSSSFVLSWNPASMHPSLFKALWSLFYWLWVSYPVGKHALISLHIRSMWETTVMHKQVSGCTVNFGPNFPESPFLESQTRKPPPLLENFRFGMTQSLLRNTPPFRKLQIWDDQSLLRNIYPPPTHFGKLQIWDDQSLLRNTPPTFQKTSDLGWPQFTPEYPPDFGKLQIWDDHSLLRNTPPPRV